MYIYIYSFIHRVTPTTDTFSFNWDLVKDDILKTLCPYKALGPDKISPKDLKLSQESLVQGLFETLRRVRIAVNSLSNGNNHKLQQSSKKGIN